MKWAVGVTTVPARRGDLLPRTLRSIDAAGFPPPRLFVDGENNWAWWEKNFPGYELTLQWPALRTYANWFMSAWELYQREASADRYVLFQDDMVCCRGLRRYLESVPYPDRGYLNLFSFAENERLVGPQQPSGWREGVELTPRRGGREYHGKMQQRGLGAVALVFDREALLTLLTHPHMVSRAKDATGYRKVDGGIVESMNKAGWREYIHNPSLVQHTGDHSVMGNPRHRGADTFPGEEWDAMSLLAAAKAGG